MIHGLQNLVNSMGTVHSIQLPPERADFLTDTEYEAAYEAWYWRTVAWTSVTKESRGDA